jgi:hypothetical protein
MQSGTGRRAAGAPRHGAYRRCGTLLAAALLAAVTAACQHDRGPMAALPATTPATVAFESIDGPPIGVFHRLVQNLSEEADGRQVAVVSREGPAHYRVRGYLAAHIAHRKTTIAWVWDVYDTAQNRALRIAGEETVPGKRSVRDGWTAADERVLRRIAQASMTNLAAFLAAGSPTQPMPAQSTAVAEAPATPAPPPASAPQAASRAGAAAMALATR